jgi:hypothetical protein
MVTFQDVGEFGFAPKGVTATDLFRSRAEQAKAAANKRKKTDGLLDVIPGGSVLEDIITPVRYGFLERFCTTVRLWTEE